MPKTSRPYGLWDSPISPRLLAGRTRLLDVQWGRPASGTPVAVWLEARSDQTYLLARHGQDAPRELATGVRARLGYGGGDFSVRDDLVVYADAKSGRLMRLQLSLDASQTTEPEPLTPAFGSAAAPRISADGRWVAYVHHDDRDTDRIAIVDAVGRLWPQILVEGADFYAYPRFSPDGRHFAWIEWRHPQMPWDGTQLLLANVRVPDAEGLPSLAPPRIVAGGPETAIFQPEFSVDASRLLYVSDESGIGQLHEWRLATGEARQITRGDAEHGAPPWVQEMRTYALAADDTAYVALSRHAADSVVRVDLRTGEARPVATWRQYTDAAQLATTTDGRGLAALVSSSVLSPRVVAAEDAVLASPTILARSGNEALAAAALSVARPISWPCGDGEVCHGLFYPPASERYTAGDAACPPLVVLVHGGPTSQADACYDPQIQFLATRGYAVLAVNHRGSTGYGRAYMLKLRRAWGVVDVEDSVSGMRHVVEQGWADGTRTAIMGGSAGGYTVLQTMVSHPEAFTAGVSCYGIANQFSLVADTHKFESRYNDSLMGVLPDDVAVYRARSPLFHAGKIRRPLAIFQGEDDKVVPKDQAEMLVKALQRNGVPHVYHLYPGEGHGWRKAETIEHYFTALAAFLRQHLLFS